MLSHFSCVPLFVTLWSVAHQTPLSMGFSRQEYWGGLPCSPPGDLPNPGIKLHLRSPTLAGGFFTTSATCCQRLTGRLTGLSWNLKPLPQDALEPMLDPLCHPGFACYHGTCLLPHPLVSSHQSLMERSGVAGTELRGEIWKPDWETRHSCQENNERENSALHMLSHVRTTGVAWNRRRALLLGWLRLSPHPNELCPIMQNKPHDLGAGPATIISLAWQVFQPDCTWLVAGVPLLEEEGKQTLQKTLPRIRARTQRLVVVECSDFTHS